MGKDEARCISRTLGPQFVSVVRPRPTSGTPCGTGEEGSALHPAFGRRHSRNTRPQCCPVRVPYTDFMLAKLNLSHELAPHNHRGTVVDGRAFPRTLPNARSEVRAGMGMRHLFGLVQFD